MPLLFFKKLFSFSNSAFSRRRRRRSSIISNWDFSSSLFWHSSRYERTRLETVAPDMPYSATRLAIVRPSWMCARTTFRLIFESCAFLLCWHYNLSGRGVTNSLYHYNSFGCFVWTQSLFGVGSERNSEWSSLDRTGIPYCFPTVSKLYEAVRIQLGYYIPEQAEIMWNVMQMEVWQESKNSILGEKTKKKD